jgi:stage III sporulation protein AA
METKEKMVFKMDEVNNFERDILRFLCADIRNIFKKTYLADLMTLEEIRLRANKPIMLQKCDGSFFLSAEGKLTKSKSNLFYVTPEQIMKTLELISENSIYAFQDEIRNGFLTLKGGHRVGICGRAVIEGNNIKNIKDISGLNIRISREVTGCSSKILKHILDGKGSVYNTLIISPPGCGKTTILRDITRYISDGIDHLEFQGIKVGIIDERSEIAACFKGVPQNRVGVRTDVMDACPKQIGMTMMLRSMSPEVIVTDEIGGSGDKEAVMQVLNAGVKIITSTHGYSMSELKMRREILSLVEEKVFDRYIVLSGKNGPGTVEEIIDRDNNKIAFKG